jgi:prolyl-tRNA editing enzyme YbaK/EbsC (Cys-tRNA(Pro) deacylase)
MVAIPKRCSSQAAPYRAGGRPSGRARGRAERALRGILAAVGVFNLGTLTTVAARQQPDLVGPASRAALDGLGWLDLVGVVEIDPDLSDTAKSQERYQLPPETLANCVIVGGKREGEERMAACVVLFTTRADVNGVVRRRLDVRKVSFLPMDRAVELTGMEYGGINPIGLPGDWPVLVDVRVAQTEVVLIGSGVRRSKLLLPGSLLAQLPGAEVVDGLGVPVDG